MKFTLKKGAHPNIVKYPNEDIAAAKSFAKRLKNEFGDFLKAVVLFGSAARKKTPVGQKGDIDVLIVVDDLSIRMTREVIEVYRLIVEKTLGKVSTRLHVTSMTITSFWEYLRAGDPVAINILRDGIALLDTGFFDPMQALLIQGRIKPTKESVWVYFGRAPRTLLNSKWHILQATLDLYWAVIDATHAALMHIGETPPSPQYAGDLLEKRLVKEHKLEAKYAKTMDRFYKLMKGITHREIKEIKGPEYEKLYKEAEDFVNRMQKFIEK
ncbi:nucleotidyltransferase domain-containing protein [Candidatus Woesearchaeota archaeon]|nr:nucleotidyltransferase domain-containing protein [Candidatus Woesearchaeota archaeon]